MGNVNHRNSIRDKKEEIALETQGRNSIRDSIRDKGRNSIRDKGTQE